MLNPKDDTGQELDAKFTLEKLPDGFALTVESRGGSDTGPRPSRNKQYIDGMILHLRRMVDHNMLLTEIQVASKNALKLDEDQRRVWPKGYPQPLRMKNVSDLDHLRLAIGRESAVFQNKSRSSGNNTKKMRLIVQSPETAVMSLEQIEAIFIGTPSMSPWIEEATHDEDELVKRVFNVRELARKLKGTRLKPPTGNKDVKRVRGISERFVRDPNVIAWVLETADGHCELCKKKAPFVRENGEPYLEVHHVRHLAEGGPDTIDNAIACCPNCHRNLHHSADRHCLRTRVIDQCERLKDWPLRVKIAPSEPLLYP